MKQRINIAKYIGKDGKYIFSENNSFKQNFSFLELKHLNLMLRINKINRLCYEHTKKWKKEMEKYKL